MPVRYTGRQPVYDRPRVTRGPDPHWCVDRRIVRDEEVLASPPSRAYCALADASGDRTETSDFGKRNIVVDG